MDEELYKRVQTLLNLEFLGSEELTQYETNELLLISYEISTFF